MICNNTKHCNYGSFCAWLVRFQSSLLCIVCTSLFVKSDLVQNFSQDCCLTGKEELDCLSVCFETKALSEQADKGIHTILT